MKEHKKVIKRDDLKGATHLEVSVYYTKGGANFFFRGTISRGYYLSVRPVTIRDGITSFKLFTESERLLFETARFSEKQMERAVAMAREFEDELISAVIAKNKAA